jgi:hypothetical protein
MNRDLLLAILSMDSYNRGYGRGIKFSSDESSAPRNEIGARIGNATISAQNITAAAQTAGFYALAYNWTHKDSIGIDVTETIIAYRGTDDNIGSEATGGSDLYYGYELAVGNFSAPQSTLARSFYQAVTGVDQEITVTVAITPLLFYDAW